MHNTHIAPLSHFVFSIHLEHTEHVFSRISQEKHSRDDVDELEVGLKDVEAQDAVLKEILVFSSLS